MGEEISTMWLVRNVRLVCVCVCERGFTKGLETVVEGCLVCEKVL